VNIFIGNSRHLFYLIAGVNTASYEAATAAVQTLETAKMVPQEAEHLNE
jgi:hypothetical protein